MAIDIYGREEDLPLDETGRTTGNDSSWRPPNFTGMPVATPTAPTDWRSQVDPGLLSRAGGVQANDEENIAKYGVTPYLAELEKRAKGTGERQYDSQSAQGNTLYGSGTGNAANVPGGARTSSAPAFTNTAPTFDDPSSRLLEDYALDRFGQRTNPDPNSGTAIFEKYARELIDTLKGPVYSAQDESIIKGKALDTIMGEQDTTIQQWMEELSRRGIPPSSGPALDGIRKIQEHYKTLRTNVESQFARDAIQQTRTQRTQVLDTAGQLANSEESRLREAGAYAAMPYEMQNAAFQRNLQLVGAGGSPASLLNSALNLFNTGQAADAQSSANKAALASGLMEYIGYILGR